MGVSGMLDGSGNEFVSTEFAIEEYQRAMAKKKGGEV
jgi:hypothetical protein